MPFTLATLIVAMVSASDNTATDLLIDFVGRENLEKMSNRNVPFLTTREMLALKFGDGRHYAAEYSAASVDRKRAILKELGHAQFEPKPTTFDPTPEIEWFFTTKEMVDLIELVHEDSAFNVNAGPFQDEYDRVAFKGGWEPGVINYTVRAEAASCVVSCSATWNNPNGLDEQTFVSVVKGAIEGCFRARSK